MTAQSQTPAGGPAARFNAPRITLYTAAFIAILALAAFTRFYRLGTPDQCYFDEVYFPTTGAEILHGDDRAWEWIGHENTHPPLSKLFMAAGQGIFGKETSTTDNGCWGDAEDKDKKTDPDWIYKPFGWRFFGALAGVGAVVFMYLLAKRLFHSEIAGLAGSFLLTVEGLAFAQSRIATPDTYVLFFVLGCVYFLVSNRFLLSGLFFGAAMATKWNAAFVAVPIVLYFAWRLYRGFAETRDAERPKLPEIALPAGLGALYAGVALTVWRYIGTKQGQTYDPLGGPLQALALLLVVGGALVALWGLLRLLQDRGSGGPLLTPAGRVYLETAIVFGVFFLVVPFYVYALTYVPMLLNGHSLAEARDLNRMAYDFHSNLDATHPYQSDWNTWPIMQRPIYLYLGDGNAKIYSFGNPVIFWLGLPALAFALYQGLKHVRASVDAATGRLSVRGRLELGQPAVLFVVLSYLGFWLPWAAQPRIMFIYHYLPAVAFLVLALAYAVHWLWDQRLSRDVAVSCGVLVSAAALNRLSAYQGMPEGLEYISWAVAVLGIFALALSLVRLASLPSIDAPPDEPYWGRVVALGFLATAGVTFAYFYPHFAAVHVSHALDESYYWFGSWR